MTFFAEVMQERLRMKQAERREGFGGNIPNCLADFDVPFPWEAELQSVSPRTELHSYLLPYWYRLKARWVLYDCLPRPLIPDDDASPGVPMTGRELLSYLEGAPPRDREEWDRCPFVSDVQHEFYRRYRVYARPFWVLEGELGGHQVNFSPWQQNVLTAKGLPTDPPAIGSLPACPFDNRAMQQLRHLNRLHQVEDQIDRLRKSGSPEMAAAEMASMQREIREAEARFIEAQMTPLVEATSSLMRGVNPRSEHADQLVVVKSGKAAEAKDAYQQYLETGDYALRDVTGH